MAERVSTMDVRARIGDMLNRVALRHEEFVIERKGKALAALVSVERLEQMRRAARQGIRDFLERQRQGPGRDLSDEEAMQVALNAQREARNELRNGKRAKKPRRTPRQ
jgi:PHD/YefM family antitoxin component YafN of YafNO toxin-antitoxin module